MAGSTIADRQKRERSVRPKGSDTHRILQPIVESVSGDLEVEQKIDVEVGNGGGDDEAMEKLDKKYQQLKNKVEEYFDDDNGKAYEPPPMVRSPPQPTKEEFESHQTTHTPYAPWCKHCLAARATRMQHPSKGRKAMVVPDVDTGVGPIKVSSDYMYMHERKGKYREAAYNPPHMVMIEHSKGRCWAYRVPNKGVLEDAYWLLKRMVQDLDNMGLRHHKIRLKSDQEPAIISVQRAIQEMRPNVIPTNSLVGESECNGRVENTIRRIQEKVRVLRHQVEQGIKERIFDNAPIMAWLVRWAAELLSKYPFGDDGRIPFERIRNEACAVPLVPFGETIMHLPLQTASGSKGDPIKRQGVWLGTVERTEEVVVGTTRGIVKCRIGHRFAENERWNREMVLGMMGVPWETIPGRRSKHLPVEITEEGHEVIVDDKTNKDPDINDEDEDNGVKLRGGLDRLHISKKVVGKYGATRGCPACREIQRRGQEAGRLGYNHSSACRQRIFNEMTRDPEYKPLVDKHGNMKTSDDKDLVALEQQIGQAKWAKRAINVIEQRMMAEGDNLGSMLNSVMMKMLGKEMDVAEVYSPPRVTAMAQKMGLRAGWSSDLTICDEIGQPGGFNKVNMRNKAIRQFIRDRPIPWTL